MGTRKVEHIVPVTSEEAVVRTREREGDSVHVRKVDRGRDEVVRVPVTREHVDVQRIPINAAVDGPVGPWHEGDTLVVPVMEQVVRLQWIVREEIRIMRRSTREEREQPIHLVREEAIVERTAPEHGHQHERR